MQAVRFHEYGGPEKLMFETVAEPHPKPGEVRVKVSAVGVNFVETYQRRGWYNVSLPLIPGGEFAGVVDSLGEGVTDVQVGDRVATASGSGAYSEVCHRPGCQAGAGTHGCHTGAGGRPAAARDDRPLPGPFHLSCQRGRYCPDPCRCWWGRAVAGTYRQAALAREAGADEIILYTQADFEQETKRITDGKGAAVVYDSVGKTTFQKSLNCLRPRGMLVLFGQSSGPVDPFDPQILQHKGSLFITRPTLGHYTATHEELTWRASDIFNWYTGGQLKMRIDKTFPLAEAAAAHQYLEARATKGKVLLLPCLHLYSLTADVPRAG